MKQSQDYPAFDAMAKSDGNTPEGAAKFVNNINGVTENLAAHFPAIMDAEREGIATYTEACKQHERIMELYHHLSSMMEHRGLSL